MSQREKKKKLNLAEMYNINEKNLDLRKQFIRLGEEERTILEELIPWAEEVAPQIARDFYDWQFSFPPTRDFLVKNAQERGFSPEGFRKTLEETQAEYFRTIFTGARENWGEDYFNNRLFVGWVHDQINLPFKWYIGSYSEYQHLTYCYLTKSFGDPEKVIRIWKTLLKVFNYDMQAVGDSFLLNTLQSMGLGVVQIPVEEGQDKTECLDLIKEDVQLLLSQARELGNKHINHEVLQREIPGELGRSFALMTQSLKEMVRQMAGHVESLAESSQKLSGVSKKMNDSAEKSSEQILRASHSVSQVNEKIQSLVSGVEEMNTSIGDIASNVSVVAQVAKEAVEMAKSANELIGRLGETNQEIEGMAKLISSITTQTKILALNATIESTRPEESDAGFGRVTREIKGLARVTAKSTSEISKKTEAIQINTKESVEALSRIAEIISHISLLQNSITGSVEEQAKTTWEITHHVVASATFLSEISQNMVSVSQASRSTAKGASDAKVAAQDLEEMAIELKKILSQFR